VTWGALIYATGMIALALGIIAYLKHVDGGDLR